MTEIPLDFHSQSPEQMQSLASQFAETMARRRTVRHYTDKPVERAVIDACLRAAVTAPSGANRQPWHFVVVEDATVKHQIREAAEAEEHEFYTHRATTEWLEALAPLGTDASKPFLDIAPVLIAIFYERYGLKADGSKFKTYYAPESVGIACGILIAALHQAGLATLTHTPSPMGFLKEILGRPSNETPFLLLVVGHPALDARVPDIQRKPFSEVVSYR